MSNPIFDLPPRSVAVVLGTRPEIIKLRHVIRLLGPAVNVIHTGQDYDSGLSDPFLETFGIADPTVYPGVGGKTRGDQIGTVVSAHDDIWARIDLRYWSFKETPTPRWVVPSQPMPARFHYFMSRRV